MKSEYMTPSLEWMRFDTEKVLFDPSDVFQGDDDLGDQTIIKPFG